MTKECKKESMSNNKTLDVKKMRNIKIMEEMSIRRPACWIEWDTWTGADAPDCDEGDDDDK